MALDFASALGQSFDLQLYAFGLPALQVVEVGGVIGLRQLQMIGRHRPLSAIQPVADSFANTLDRGICLLDRFVEQRNPCLLRHLFILQSLPLPSSGFPLASCLLDVRVGCRQLLQLHPQSIKFCLCSRNIDVLEYDLLQSVQQGEALPGHFDQSLGIAHLAQTGCMLFRCDGKRLRKARELISVVETGHPFVFERLLVLFVEVAAAAGHQALDGHRVRRSTQRFHISHTMSIDCGEKVLQCLTMRVWLEIEFSRESIAEKRCLFRTDLGFSQANMQAVIAGIDPGQCCCGVLGCDQKAQSFAADRAFDRTAPMRVLWLNFDQFGDEG